MVCGGESILEKTETFVRQILEGDASGHDWWHVARVRRNAIRIATDEGVDHFIVELAALLHDIDDYKLRPDQGSNGPARARSWMQSQSIEKDVEDHVCEIISDLSFKGARVATPMRTREGMVVQDADRLEAIGAIGIARAFAYGGSKGRGIYDPAIKPEIHSSFEAYKRNKGPSLNHFYEKLLFVKDLMNTETAKRMAEDRHRFTEEFLNRFLMEWEGGT